MNQLPLASLPQPVPAPAQPPPDQPGINQSPQGGRRLLHVLIMAFLIVAFMVDAWIIYLLISLVAFGYSGGNDPTKVNGLAFPIAIATYVVVGIPATAVTSLLVLGYVKTMDNKPRTDTSRKIDLPPRKL